MVLTFTDVLEAAWRHEYVLNWTQSAPTGRRSASGSYGVGAQKRAFVAALAIVTAEVAAGGYDDDGRSSRDDGYEKACGFLAPYVSGD